MRVSLPGVWCSVARQHPGAVLNFIDGKLNPDRKTRYMTSCTGGWTIDLSTK